MTSLPSSMTPLGFTREYQTYRAANAAIPFVDTRLLAAVRFWSRFPDALGSESYASFWLEDLPPLLTVAPQLFDDLHPDELAEIAAFLSRVDAARLGATLVPSGLWDLAAHKWMYVGDMPRALGCLAKGGVNVPDLSNLQVDASGEPHLLPSSLASRLGDDYADLRGWLTRLDAEWRSVRESGVTNQATCVLVERDIGGRPIRGRLRTLEAHVEPLPKGRDTDEVVFGHQLVAADDPQVRGAYSALAALRNAECGIRNAESRTQENLQDRSQGVAQPRSSIPNSAFLSPHSYLRARFTFANGGNREPYGGDSLAFACLVSAHGDLWAKDLHRERRLVSSAVALTGAIQDGVAGKVSDETLPKKIERVFFSPLTYLVVPQANRIAAETEIARLQKAHPRRRLRLITAEFASDLITDGNIAMPERVCFGEYAIRAAAKYSRSLKVQVPILILLLFIAGWIILPYARDRLDRNPVAIEHTARGFKAMNQYGHVVWEQEYAVDSVVEDPPFAVCDLDSDGKNEILYYVATYSESPDNAKIDVFKQDGLLRFRLDPVIRGHYHGDDNPNELYTPGLLRVLALNGKPVIVTGANAQNPSRFHIRIWSASGDTLGWYVNPGVVSPLNIQARDIDLDGNEELVFAALNIRMRSASIFALKAEGSHGVGPPYWDEQYDLSHVIRGNQLHYMFFPPTDVTLVLANRLYNYVGKVHDVSSGGFRYDVREGMDVPDSATPAEVATLRSMTVNYYVDSTLRVVRVDVEDSFKARREALVRAGKLPHIPWPEYFRRLQDTVTYWTSERWVSDRAL